MKIMIDEACIKEVYGKISAEEPHDTKINIGAIMSSPMNGKQLVFSVRPRDNLKVLDIMDAMEEGRVTIKTYLEIDDAKK